jgi:hypothetical protein
MEDLGESRSFGRYLFVKSSDEDRHMTMEGVLGHLLSSLANGSQELTRESLENDRPPRLNGLFDKRHRLLMRWRTRLIDCAAVRACEGCSRPIRRWDRRVLMTDQGYIHQSCWEDGEFFRELVRHYDPNLIGPAFPEAPDLRRAAWLIESIVRSFYDEAQRNRKDSPQSEYLRGMLGGAKSMLGGLRGQGPKEWVLGEVRKRVGKPLPSVIPLARDGNRYGWDAEAEAGLPRFFRNPGTIAQGNLNASSRSAGDDVPVRGERTWNNEAEISRPLRFFRVSESLCSGPRLPGEPAAGAGRFQRSGLRRPCDVAFEMQRGELLRGSRKGLAWQGGRSRRRRAASVRDSLRRRVRRSRPGGAVRSPGSPQTARTA